MARKEAQRSGPGDDRSPIPGMSWTEWQRMLLGLLHGAQMIRYVRDILREQDKALTRTMAEADLEAIVQAHELLANVETMTVRKKAGLQ